MPNLPQLRVVPLERIRPHEKVDPLRVERLATRIEAEGSQLNPVVCTEDPSGNLILLDGATRTAALKRLDLSYGIVQLVEPESVILETWHHVVRQAPPDVVLGEIESQDDLVLAQDEGPPRICTPDGVVQTVHGGDGISMFKMLSSLVDSYVGRWKLNRVIDPDLENVAWRYPDWSAVIEFPALTIEDVMKAAIDEDPVPAGMTRFVVPERALRINAELSLLRRPGSELEKQELLDRLLEERARAGRIRRYDEAVVILDD
jgi:hypothetical protein